MKSFRGIFVALCGIAGAIAFTVFFSYRIYEVDGSLLSEYLSFFSFLDTSIRTSSYSLHVSSAHVGTSEVGAFGYAITAAQLIGFGIGSAITFAMLHRVPYCDNCQRYLKRISSRTRIINDDQNTLSKVKGLHKLVTDKQYTEAISIHKNFELENPGLDSLKVKLTKYRCAECGTNFLDIELKTKNSASKKYLHFGDFTDQELQLD